LQICNYYSIITITNYKIKILRHIMAYEWDENKNRSNLAKHNIDFALATEVFSDPEGVETTRVVNSEERIQLIGRIDTCIVSVAYTFRRGNIRIISARIASKKERLIYGQKTAIGKTKKNV